MNRPRPTWHPIAPRCLPVVDVWHVMRGVGPGRASTDDWAMFGSTGRSAACDRELWSLSSVDGRTGDFIRTRSGRQWSPTMPDWASSFGKTRARETQLRQTSLDEVEIVLVPAEDFGPSDLDTWAEGLRALLSEPGMRVTVRLVDHIERPVSMKQRFVVGLDILADNDRRLPGGQA